jgi:hypothetical protein
LVLAETVETVAALFSCDPAYLDVPLQATNVISAIMDRRGVRQDVQKVENE